MKLIFCFNNFLAHAGAKLTTKQQNNMPRSFRRGRIRPHERDTNDTALVLGQNLAVSNEFRDQYNESIEVSMSNNSRKDYRCRLVRMAEFWKQNCQEYYEIGVKEVGDEELQDASKFYFGRYKLDLIYEGLNARYVLQFLMSTKRKEKNGKLKSFEDTRKYKDAILWGARTAGERLPTAFYEEMDKYLASYKKQFVKARKEGEVDEQQADPITFTLYQSILLWAVKANNIFVWFWTLAQWNCMARCGNIDPLGFHNFKVGQDSIICKYDDQKADKAGDRLSEKNIYANPFEWTQCFWTGLGVYVALNCDSLGAHERLFLDEGVKEGSASSRYSEQLMTLVEVHKAEVMAQMRLEHFNPYGFRKGSATHACSGTTLSPSLPSIARRGEWSQGMVLDVYWHFAAIGDHYLGRVLACLQPNDAGFATLPPHFNVANPMENQFVLEAMRLSFQPIMTNYAGQPNDPTAMLLRCLACIVHHADSLLEFMVEHPGHDFSKLAILHDRQLLGRLQELVTTEPTAGIMTTPTGIPPHIELATQVQKVLDLATQLLGKMGQQTAEVIEAVQNAIEEKAWESGHVTGTRLMEVLNEFQTNSMTAVDQRLVEIRDEFAQTTGGLGDGRATTTRNAANPARQPQGGAPTNMFAYDGRFWGVPKGFQFPKVKLREAMRFWLCGQSVSEDGSCRVRPFKSLTADLLPTKALKDVFNLHWKPIFGFVTEAAEFPNQADATADSINAACERSVAHLKSTVSYCFAKKKHPETDWLIGTWSVRVARSSIEKNGTDSDKAKLPPAGIRNKARKSGKRNRKESSNPLYLHRQRKRMAKLAAAAENPTQEEPEEQAQPAMAHPAQPARDTQPARATHQQQSTRPQRPRQTPQQRTRPQQRAQQRARPQQSANAFLAAFPAPETNPTIEARDREIQQQVQQEMRTENQERQANRARERAAIGDAVAVDGTVLFVGRRPGSHAPNIGDNSTVSRTRYTNSLSQAASASGGTPCAITGCSWSQLVPDHHCHNSRDCRKLVHNLCAQGANLCSAINELNMHCSMACKRAGDRP